MHDAAFLPTFLLPREPSVGALREAAARYQADLVLVFSTETRPHSRTTFFFQERAEAYCVAECAVLDVRTGILPFTARSRANVPERKPEGGDTLDETIAQLELEAIEAAMQENAASLLGFLDATR